ncbi:hypothetical protein HN587_02680 [Candidatus Woesearchaeota archaeon]|jgi:hypothetical protein|nr:hypothetical protein [Candidatus Woesearchaeota archaeon]
MAIYEGRSGGSVFKVPATSIKQEDGTYALFIGDNQLLVCGFLAENSSDPSMFGFSLGALEKDPVLRKKLLDSKIKPNAVISAADYELISSSSFISFGGNSDMIELIVKDNSDPVLNGLERKIMAQLPELDSEITIAPLIDVGSSDSNAPLVTGFVDQTLYSVAFSNGTNLDPDDIFELLKSAAVKRAKINSHVGDLLTESDKYYLQNASLGKLAAACHLAGIGVSVGEIEQFPKAYKIASKFGISDSKTIGILKQLDDIVRPNFEKFAKWTTDRNGKNVSLVVRNGVRTTYDFDFSTFVYDIVQVDDVFAIDSVRPLVDQLGEDGEISLASISARENGFEMDKDYLEVYFVAKLYRNALQLKNTYEEIKRLNADCEIPPADGRTGMVRNMRKQDQANQSAGEFNYARREMVEAFNCLSQANLIVREDLEYIYSSIGFALGMHQTDPSSTKQESSYARAQSE